MTDPIEPPEVTAGRRSHVEEVLGAEMLTGWRPVAETLEKLLRLRGYSNSEIDFATMSFLNGIAFIEMRRRSKAKV